MAIKQRQPLELFRLKPAKAAAVSEISEATASSPVPPEERVNFHIGNPVQDERLVGRSSASPWAWTPVRCRREFPEGDPAGNGRRPRRPGAAGILAPPDQAERALHAARRLPRNAPHPLALAFKRWVEKAAGPAHLRPGGTVRCAGGDLHQRRDRRDLQGLPSCHIGVPGPSPRQALPFRHRRSLPIFPLIPRSPLRTFPGTSRMHWKSFTRTSGAPLTVPRSWRSAAFSGRNPARAAPRADARAIRSSFWRSTMPQQPTFRSRERRGSSTAGHGFLTPRSSTTVSEGLARLRCGKRGLSRPSGDAAFPAEGDPVRFRSGIADAFLLREPAKGTKHDPAPEPLRPRTPHRAGGRKRSSGTLFNLTFLETALGKADAIA